MSAPCLESLPPLREIIRQANVSAKKSLGQNFLFDLNITRRIAKAAGPLEGVRVLEIGPGPGGLTRALFLEGASEVIALERDERFRPALQQISDCDDAQLVPLFEDALRVNYGEIAQNYGASRIVANLPYNIATPLMVGWLTYESWPPWYDKFVVMLQREVAERMVAERGSENYGRLAVLAQARARPKLLFTLPPSVFTPSPKVSSALIEVVPQANLAELPIRVLEAVTGAAFGQRRKMLRSSLGGLGVRPLALLEAAGIDQTVRAEELAVADFVCLANALTRLRLSNNRS